MNRQEFIEEVKKSQNALRRFLLALCCGDSFLAEDIAQEAYLKAWISIDGFRNDASFSTWLRRIAYTTFLNAARKERPTENIAECHDGAALSSDTADGKFRYESLYMALGMLTAKERASILLYYMEGYTVREIAEIQKVKEEAVRQQLSRGRARLHKILEKD